ncbi:hypothetical protein [Cupriavidus sp. UGS-1]|uniref:hypothetical protein n=1 Tax=Cupriavidus sp. UGS-1 TaxID=2899826 RepID=UPI001E3A5D8A|nr:hypothetical protein [Cupriavidus sp. UGS-1]MCD9123000.1 hypothetical protein [Cupriavidus sp. UGS-1]
MGDSTSFIQCGRLEDLATIPRSKKERILRVREGDIGCLNVQVEGHEYLVIRTHQFGIQVCRLDIEDLTPAARFIQAIKEFFTHRVADFFQLRGVGSRSYRIGKTVESWLRFPDGQENAKGPPLMATPSITIDVPGHRTTESESDYVHDHLANHCPRRAREIAVPTASRPLSDRDRVWRDNAACRLVPQAAQGSHDAAPPRPLDDAACEAELMAAFDHADADPTAFASLFAALEATARRSSSASIPADSSPLVRRAILLLLGNAISTDISDDLQPLRRSPQQAIALLDMLRTPWHQLNSGGEPVVQCWQAARRLARCELGFQVLCGLIGSPPDLPAEAVHQWHAALRIYFQSCDHLIAASENQFEAADSPKRGAIIGSVVDARNALRALTGHPLRAAEYAAAMLMQANHPRANRLAYRALLAAVKLLTVREHADSAWLKAQRQAARHRVETGSLLALPLDKDEAMALALWRNGFRDDLDDGLLAQFQRLLNKLIVEWLPHDDVAPDTGLVGRLIPDESPLAFVLGHPLTRGATRRTVTQQSEDHQAAFGRMTRLLVLHMKMVAGVPLRRHEALLRDALLLRDEIRRLGLARESEAEVDAQFENVISRLDNAARIIDIDGGIQPFSATDFERLSRELGVPSSRMALREVADQVEEIQSRYPEIELDRLRPAWPGRMEEDTGHTKRGLVNLVRANLLTQWVSCTELGIRMHAYTVTNVLREAVIADLVELPGLESHRPAFQEELGRITHIDLELIKAWAVEAGIVPAESTAAREPAGSPANAQPAELREIGRRFQQHRDVVAMIRLGRDKVDASVSLPESPRSREDYRRIARHLFDANLGAGASGSVTQTAGMGGSIGIDMGPAIVLTGPAPSIGLSISHEHSAARTQTFGISGSSVGGETMTVSEAQSEIGQAGAGISVNTPVALRIGLDAHHANGYAFEFGIAIRTPPTPDSRDWVKTGQQAIDVIFGQRLAQKLAKAKVQAVNAAAQMPQRALQELCLQCFQPLLRGALALNVFENRTADTSVAAGISTGVGASLIGGSVEIAVNARLAKETDRLHHQSRTDLTGSTRLDVQGIGTGSRYSAAIRLLATVLPAKMTHHLTSGLSTGPMAGVIATFCERGVHHFMRRETRDGITQSSFAWDIVFRNVDDLIAHLNTPAVRRHWDQCNAPLKPLERWSLDERLQYLRLHARHSNQSYMVRRHLKESKLAELNALTALSKGLESTKGPYSHVGSRYELARQCWILLSTDDHYELGGFGVYAGDHLDTQNGVHGSALLTTARSVSLSSELLWFSARLATSTQRNPEETDTSGKEQTGTESVF